MPSGVSAPWAGSSSGLPGSHPSNDGRSLPGRLGGGRRTRRCGLAPLTTRGDCMAEARPPGHGPLPGVRVVEPAGYRARPVRRHAPRRPGRRRGPRRRRRAHDGHGVRQRTDPSAPQPEPARRPSPARRIASASSKALASLGTATRRGFPPPPRPAGQSAEPVAAVMATRLRLHEDGVRKPPLKRAAESPAVASRRQTPKPTTRHRPVNGACGGPTGNHTAPQALPGGSSRRRRTRAAGHTPTEPRGLPAVQPVAAVHDDPPAEFMRAVCRFRGPPIDAGVQRPEAY